MLLGNNHFEVMLLDNAANAYPQGNGSNPLHHAGFSDNNLFLNHSTGFNFEHIFQRIIQ